LTALAGFAPVEQYGAFVAVDGGGIPPSVFAMIHEAIIPIQSQAVASRATASE
jgi:hypothetical protein